MELSKKTTILLTPELHRRLSCLARERGKSIGMLMREACEAQYGLVSGREAVSAVRELGELALPVADVADLKRESVPDPDDLMP